MDDEHVGDSIARQSVELWAHLPEDEVGEEEPLKFRTDDRGNLLVAAERASYKLQDGVAWRYRPVAGGEEISIWRFRTKVATTIKPSNAGLN